MRCDVARRTLPLRVGCRAMRAVVCMLALGAAVAFRRNYNRVDAQTYHEHLDVAEEQRKAILFAFIDERSPSYDEEESRFNDAVADIGCLFPGGSHLMIIPGTDGREEFISNSFGEDWQQREDEIPCPFIGLFRPRTKVGTYEGKWVTEGGKQVGAAARHRPGTRPTPTARHRQPVPDTQPRLCRHTLARARYTHAR